VGVDYDDVMPIRLLLILSLQLLLPAMTLLGAELGDGLYSVPLVGRYAVVRDEGGTMCSLVELSATSRGAGLSFTKVLPGVEEIAVVGNIIAGKANGEFFVLDTARADAKPQLLQTDGQWVDALKATGITQPVQLATPDSMAATLPENVLRPGKFRMMGGRLGYSDDAWSLIIQIAGLVIAFFLGAMTGPRRSPLAVAVVLGIVVNVVAQMFIAGGGPGAFVGFFLLPLYCVLAALLGKGVRRLIPKKSPAL
jgi:hypothetical protein